MPTWDKIMHVQRPGAVALCIRLYEQGQAND